MLKIQVCHKLKCIEIDNIYFMDNHNVLHIISIKFELQSVNY